MKVNARYILVGIIIILLGFLLIIFRSSLIYFIVELTQVILTAMIAWELLKTFILQRQQGQLLNRLLAGAKMIMIGIILIILTNYPTFITSGLVYLIGLYQSVIGVIGLISYVIIRRDRVAVDRSQFWIPIVHIIFGIYSFTSPQRVSQTLLRLGVYLIFVGLTIAFDGGRLILSRAKIINQLSSQIRIPLPVVLEAIIPDRYIVKFNQAVQSDIDSALVRAEDNTISQESYSSLSENNLVNILIQVGSSGFDRIGHVDISYKGKVYSYGNHDVESHKVFGSIGDGVLIEADENLYLDYLKSRRVSVFRFGILLKDEEAKDFQQSLNTLLNQTVQWDITTDKQKNSFIGRVIQTANGQGNKFKEGRYKTYFVLGTNCVLLVDELLGSNGINIINLSGILSPGSYYDYFDKLFHVRGSNVISKTLVHPKLESNKVVYNMPTK